MLRAILSPLNAPTLYAGSVTVGGSTVTVDKGLNDIRNPTRPLAGAASYTWRNPFGYRASDLTQSNVHICTPIRPADLFLRGQTYTNDPATPTIRNANGNDGALDVVAFGSRFPSARELVQLQTVGTSRIAARINWGKVASGGTMSIGGGDFSVQKTATGVYSITFRKPFALPPTIMLTSASTGSPTVGLESKTASGCVVKTALINFVAADADFYIAAIGQDSRENDGGYVDRPLFSSQRKPTMLGFTINAGASLGFGSQYASWAGGSGTNVLTFNKKFFAREPAVFATYHGTTSQQAATAPSASSNLVSIVTLDNAGAGAALSASVLVIGSNDPSEY